MLHISLHNRLIESQQPKKTEWTFISFLQSLLNKKKSVFQSYCIIKIF